MNSGFRKIMVLTQYNSHRLLEHLQFGWTFLPGKLNEYVHVLPAQQSFDKDAWYSGTADAVYQNLDIIASHAPKYMVILAGDHIYKMDYELMLQQHVATGADVTIGCLVVKREEAKGFGVMAVDAASVITDFVEKPEDPPAIPGDPEHSLASMGIYVFETKFLFEALRRDAEDPNSSRDFGKDIIPYIVKNGKAVAHRFTDSCIRAAEEIGMAISSLISQDCIVSGAIARRSLLFTGVKMGSFSSVDEGVILPYCNIGRGARLSRVILDSGVRIPEGLVVGEDPILDAKRFRRTESGVCLINKAMIERLK